MKMTINDKLAKYILDSLVESEEYSKNVKLPSGKPSASGRSKPKSAISAIKSSDEREVDEEDLEEQQKRGKKARQNARRDYQTDREEMRKGIGWKDRAENRKGHRRLSGMLRGAMERMKKRNASEREDSSTNWQDRMVDILLEKRGDQYKKHNPRSVYATGERAIPKRGSKDAEILGRSLQVDKTYKSGKPATPAAKKKLSGYFNYRPDVAKSLGVRSGMDYDDGGGDEPRSGSYVRNRNGGWTER
jgi:hypothetical protein